MIVALGARSLQSMARANILAAIFLLCIPQISECQSRGAAAGAQRAEALVVVGIVELLEGDWLYHPPPSFGGPSEVPLTRGQAVHLGGRISLTSSQGRAEILSVASEPIVFSCASRQECDPLAAFEAVERKGIFKRLGETLLSWSTANVDAATGAMSRSASQGGIGGGGSASQLTPGVLSRSGDRVDGLERIGPGLPPGRYWIRFLPQEGASDASRSDTAVCPGTFLVPALGQPEPAPAPSGGPGLYRLQLAQASSPDCSSVAWSTPEVVLVVPAGSPAVAAFEEARQEAAVASEAVITRALLRAYLEVLADQGR